MTRITTHPKCSWKTFTVEFSQELFYDISHNNPDAYIVLDDLVRDETELMYEKWVRSPEGKAEILDRIENAEEALSKFLAIADYDGVPDFSTEEGFLKQVAALDPEKSLRQYVFVIFYRKDIPIEDKDDPFQRMAFSIEKIPVVLKGKE